MEENTKNNMITITIIMVMSVGNYIQKLYDHKKHYRFVAYSNGATQNFQKHRQ